MLAGCVPNIELEPPNAVEAPLVAGALPFTAPKGLGVDDAGEKAKPLAGGWELLWLPAPKVKELFENMPFESDGGADGGKLLVVLPPKAPPPNMPPAFAPLSPPAGVEAPKLKLAAG